MTDKDTMTMAELRQDPLYQKARRICVGLNAWPGLMPPDAPVPQGIASLLNPNWQYTPANKTDVRATWARFGWKPTSK